MALLTSGTKKALFFEEPAEDNGRTEENLCLVIMQENIIPTYCINFSLIGYTYEQLQKSYLLQPENYMVFNSKNISHKCNQDTISANPTLNEFYSELGFEKKQDYNDVIFVKNLIVEKPSRGLLEEPLAIPKEWKKSN